MREERISVKPMMTTYRTLRTATSRDLRYRLLSATQVAGKFCKNLGMSLRIDWLGNGNSHLHNSWNLAYQAINGLAAVSPNADTTGIPVFVGSAPIGERGRCWSQSKRRFRGVIRQT